jgi:serine/threonine protein kinase
MEKFTSERYKIITELGHGGMCAAYKAVDQEDGQVVALKLLLPRYLANPKDVLRFNEEARTAGKLDHPGIAKVLGPGVSEEGRPYLAMEFVEGETLAHYLASQGQLPLEVTIEIFMQLCDALAYAHSKGVLHRDIKPSNIMIDRFEERYVKVKLLDFGIAKIMQNQDQAEQGITAPGELLGSPLYMSPEQSKGGKLDARSDMYSVGCALYECLTGGPPHLGQSVIATLIKRETEKPITLGEASMGVGFSADVESIVSKLLSADPADRYQSAGELKEDLLKVKVGQVIESKPVENLSLLSATTKTASHHYRFLSAALIIGVVAGLCMFGLCFYLAKNSRPLTTKAQAPVPVQPEWMTLLASIGSEDDALERAEAFISRKEYDKADTIISKLYIYDPKKALAEQIRDALDLYLRGNAHLELGEHAPAQSYFFRAQAMLMPIAPVSENMAQVKTGIGKNYALLRNFSQSEIFTRDAAAIREKVFGPQSIEYAKSLENVADFLMMEGSGSKRTWSKAEPLYDRAVSIYKKVYGKRDTRVADLLSFQGNSCIDNKLIPGAQARLENAIAIYEVVPIHDSTEYVLALLRLGTVYDLQKKKLKAELLDQSALAMIEANPRLAETARADAYYYLAGHYTAMASPKRKELYQEAEKYQWRALNIFEKYHGGADAELIDVLKQAADTYGASASSFGPQKRYEAEMLYKKALKICQKCPQRYSQQITDINARLAQSEEKRRKEQLVEKNK